MIVTPLCSLNDHSNKTLKNNFKVFMQNVCSLHRPFKLPRGRLNSLVHQRHSGRGEKWRSLRAALIFQRLPPPPPRPLPPPPPLSPLLFPHKRRFIKVFVRHKLIYSLWWLWAARTQHFIKYPSNLLITLCLTFLASGASNFATPSAARFPSGLACGSQTPSDTCRQQLGLMALWWDAWPRGCADTREGPGLRGPASRAELSLIYVRVKCFMVKGPSHFLRRKAVNQYGTIVRAHTHTQARRGTSRTALLLMM